MSTPTPRTKPVNLRECKIGRKLKTRQGHTFTFDGPSGDRNFPFKIKERDWLYRPDGFFFETGAASFRDIVEILPLPKKEGKKASGMPTEKPLKMTKSERELHNGQINKVIEQLKGLLKP